MSGAKVLDLPQLEKAHELLEASSRSVAGTVVTFSYASAKAAKAALKKEDLLEELKKVLGEEVTLKFEDCVGRCVLELSMRGSWTEDGSFVAVTGISWSPVLSLLVRRARRRYCPKRNDILRDSS